MVKSTEKFLYKFPFFSCFAKNGSKCAGSLVMRIFKYLCRRALLNDGAAVHEHDMIGRHRGQTPSVGDDDHGGVLIRQ